MNERNVHQGVTYLKIRVVDELSTLDLPVRWTFSINGDEQERGIASSLSPNTYAVRIDSARYQSGEGDLIVSVVDELGKRATEKFRLHFRNEPPPATVTSPRVFVGDELLILFTVTENSYLEMAVHCSVSQSESSSYRLATRTIYQRNGRM